jgi:acetoacetyl-CoA reductase
MSRVAVVTGGTRGIGAAISLALKNAGYQVAANYAGNDEKPPRLSTRKQAFRCSSGTSPTMPPAQKALRGSRPISVPVDVLVNNAGITRDAMFHKMTPQQWHDVINTNLTGLFNMTHQVWTGMRERSFGRIVNISSINGQKGQMGQVNYSAAKAGDLGFTKALAQEGAAKNITVNAICPGYIGTEMVLAVPEKVLNERIIPQIPVGRLGEPEEIARCVVFLVSDDAGFITGSTLSANGGQLFV